MLHVFQDAYGGIHRVVLVAAVHPVVHLAWYKHQAVLLHVFQGVGQLVFPLLLDVVVDQILQFLAQTGAVFEVVNADDGQIAHKFLRLLHKIGNVAGVVHFDDAKSTGVFNALHPNHPVGFFIQSKIRPKQGVCKRNDHRALQSLRSAQNRMRSTQRLFLVVNASTAT